MVEQTGFVNKPKAIRKLIPGPDGNLVVVYVDPKTGQQVENPDGYHIIQPDAGKYWDKENGNKSKQDEKPSLTDTAMGARRGDNAMLEAASRTGEPMNRSSSLTPSNPEFGNTYVNKPGIMGFAGFMPGILGTLGMAANVGTNANNTAAVNKARESVGFAPKSALSNIGSTLFDKHGYVSDAAYQDGQGNTNVTPVSFEAEDSVGRTTMTPNEARMRNELNPSFQEASAAQVKNAQESYENEFGTKGFLSSVGTAAKGLFSNIFGSNPAPTGGVIGGNAQATSVGGALTPGDKSGAPSSSPPGKDTSGWSDSH